MAKQPPAGDPQAYVVSLRGSSQRVEVDATSQAEACERGKALMKSKRGIQNFTAVPKALVAVAGQPSLKVPAKDNPTA